MKKILPSLLPEKLYYALEKEHPKTIIDLMAKASKIMNTEEVMAAKQIPGAKANNQKSSEKNEKKNKKVEKPKRYKE